MLGESSIHIEPIYSKSSPVAVNAGRDAAALFRSLCQSNRTTAIQRAERVINDQCPSPDLQVAVDAFNKEVDRSVVALVDTLDQTLGLLPDQSIKQSFDPAGNRSINDREISKRCIALLDQAAWPKRFNDQVRLQNNPAHAGTGTSVTDPPQSAKAPLPPQPVRTLFFLEKTMKLLHV